MPSAVVWIAHLALIGWAVVSSSAAVLVLDLLRRWNARSTLAGHWQSEGSSAAAPRWAAGRPFPSNWCRCSSAARHMSADRTLAAECSGTAKRRFSRRGVGVIVVHV